MRVLLCERAMEQMGVAPDRLDPPPTDTVPNAVATLVDYVARDAAIIRY